MKLTKPVNHLGVCSFTRLSFQSYESRMGISADTEGEGEEDEEVAESPDDASDDQRIIIKKEGRDGNARRYWDHVHSCANSHGHHNSAHTLQHF